MSKILILDDSSVVRERLKQLLATIAGVELSAETAPAHEGEAIARQIKPDVVIVDVHMRNGGGIRSLHEMKRIEPPPRIIVLTNEAYPEIRSRCFAEGADYFFDKSTEYQEMVSVLNDVDQARSASASGEGR